jgi:glycopeptide antibiotics resistance protein
VASIREQFAPVHWIPLQAMAGRVDLFSVTDIATQFLLFLPLGGLLAVWPLRRRGRWQHLLPALYLSVVCEVGKILVAERFLDVTHILIQMAGAAIGWIVVRRSGFPVYGEVWGERAARSINNG